MAATDSRADSGAELRDYPPATLIKMSAGIGASGVRSTQSPQAKLPDNPFISELWDKVAATDSAAPGFAAALERTRRD